MAQRSVGIRHAAQSAARWLLGMTPPAITSVGVSVGGMRMGKEADVGKNWRMLLFVFLVFFIAAFLRNGDQVWSFVLALLALLFFTLLIWFVQREHRLAMEADGG